PPTRDPRRAAPPGHPMEACNPFPIASEPPAPPARVLVVEDERADNALGWLAAIVAGSNDAIIGKDRDGRIFSWNPGAEHLYGYTAAEAIGQPISILFPPDREEEFHWITERVNAGERI